MITLIASLKGGTGKSTVNFNLAIWLAVNKHKVEIFDLDPQRTLSDVLDIRREEGYTPDVPLSHRTDELDRKALKGVEALVDVGTANMEALQHAISVADRIVAPVPPSQADVWSTQRFLQMVKGGREGAKPPEIYGFINRADTHLYVKETEETAEALELLPGIEPLKTRLYQRTAFRRSFSEGLAVFEMQPMSKAARELKQLGKELYG